MVFVDLQQSSAGFGDTPEEAVKALRVALRDAGYSLPRLDDFSIQGEQEPPWHRRSGALPRGGVIYEARRRWRPWRSVVSRCLRSFNRRLTTLERLEAADPERLLHGVLLLGRGDDGGFRLWRV
jgi:hypothetical protein